MDDLRKSALLAWVIEVMGIGAFVYGIVVDVKLWWMYSIGISALLFMALMILVSEIKRSRKCLKK